MMFARRVVIVVLLLNLMPGVLVGTETVDFSGCPEVTAPPESFFEKVRESDRQAAKEFYKKYIDIEGMPVVAAAEVAELALQRTYEIVTHMLAGRPDVLEAMVERGMYLVIIGKDQVYTDLPENRNARNPDYLNERVRGTGGFPTSFGEENLLSLPIDRYDDESIAVHEFCHTIDSTLRRIDPTWRKRKEAVYQNAVKKGLYKNTYAIGNSAEYFAEIAQAYFGCNRINNWNHGPIGRREQLKIYDPEGYELVRSTFNLNPGQDWRYHWLQTLPNVETPPAKFKIDPYLTSCQIIRVFAKALYHLTGTRPVDPNWENRGRNIQQYELRVRRMDIRFDEKLKDLYKSAVNKGLWKGTAAVHDRAEYWAEGVLAYFDAAGAVVPPNDSVNPIDTREAFKQYDPGLFALVEETMAYKGKVDWRYRK